MWGYEDTAGGRKAPCYQCKDRQVGCHAECDRYKAFITEKSANKTNKDMPMMKYLFDVKLRSYGGLYK